MVGVVKQEPFASGYGGKTHPLIAGRGNGKRQLLEVAENTLRGVPGARDAILIGPRVMEKTTLLAWLRQHVKREKQTGGMSSRVRIENPAPRINEPREIDLLFRKKSITRN